MKINKIFTFIILTCLMFVSSGCDAFDFNASFSNSSTTSSSSTAGDDDIFSTVNVVMLNDNHGVLNEEKGNLDKIASGIKSYESLGDTVKIANGDMFQGTYVSSKLKGLPMLDALNAMNFDAFVLGDCEFAWGLDEIKKYKDNDLSNGEANFPFLGANIYDKTTGKMVDWLEPYTIVEAEGLKIGIIGIIGHIEDSILSTYVENYDFVDARDIVKNYANELRTMKNCNAVIVSCHGVSESFIDTLVSYEDTYMIDGLFTGHTHSPTNRKLSRANGSSIYDLQNGKDGESFATLSLNFDENGNIKNSYGKLNYTKEYNSEGILSNIFEKYREYILESEKVLFTADVDADKEEIGITIANSMYIKYGVHFAIINASAIKTTISAGDVTYNDIYQVLPSENEVYIVNITGKDLKHYLNTLPYYVYYWGIYLENMIDEVEYQLAVIDYIYLGSAFEKYRRDDYIDTNDLIRDVFIDLIIQNA